MSAKELAKRLYYIPKLTRWTKGVGAELPEEYKKFWKEWKLQKPAAIHYIEQEGSYIRNEKTEVVRPVQNIPIPLRYPREFHEGLWGGETIVQGFKKKHRFARRYPHFWFPQLRKTVVYSEVLDLYLNTVVTNRAINLINEHHGLDHYILKTSACDLMSELALRLKRKILTALADKTLYPDDSVKREEIYNKYKEYLTAYTREEIEWYGLTYKEATMKWINKKKEQELQQIQPLKIRYRAELIAKLKEEETKAAEEKLSKSLTWSAKLLNPFKH